MQDQYAFRPCLRDCSTLAIKATDKQALALASHAQRFQLGIHKSADWWKYIGAEHTRRLIKPSHTARPREIVNAGTYGHFILE